MHGSVSPFHQSRRELQIKKQRFNIVDTHPCPCQHCVTHVRLQARSTEDEIEELRLLSRWSSRCARRGVRLQQGCYTGEFAENLQMHRDFAAEELRSGGE